jgi:hypothetical protein
LERTVECYINGVKCRSRPAALAESDSDEEPVVFCGMARLAAYDNNQKRRVSLSKKTHQAVRLGSPMHGFKRAQPKIPGGGWFRAPIELLSPSSESENGVGDTSDSTSSLDDGLRLDHLDLG